MKLCKYCKKPGRFYPYLGKVLCDEHRELHGQIRSLWEAITDLQFTRSR